MTLEAGVLKMNNIDSKSNLIRYTQSVFYIAVDFMVKIIAVIIFRKLQPEGKQYSLGGIFLVQHLAVSLKVNTCLLCPS